MSTLTTVLKDTVRRLARREIKASLAGLLKDRRLLKQAVADLKRQAAQGRKALAALGAAAGRAVPATENETTAPAGRITARGVRALRRKLKLSQAAFGKLAGISGLTIMKLEKKQGPLTLRSKTRAALLRIRALPVKEIRRQMKQASAAPAPVPLRKARKARKARG